MTFIDLRLLRENRTKYTEMLSKINSVFSRTNNSIILMSVYSGFFKDYKNIKSRIVSFYTSCLNSCSPNICNNSILSVILTLIPDY